MTKTRRTFIQETFALGTLASLFPGSSPASGKVLLDSQPSGSSEGATTLPEFNPSDYWGHLYDSVDPSIPKTRGLRPANMLSPNRRIYFYHYRDEKGEPAVLRQAVDIKPTELLDHIGDVQLILELGHFRAGAKDQAALNKKGIKESNLRIDCVQTRPMLELVSPLCWCAVASLKPSSASQLPASLQPHLYGQENSGISTILLTDGIGKMSVNVYSTHESLRDKLVRYSLQVGQYAAQANFIPIFPQVSIPAMRTCSMLWSHHEENAHTIMHFPFGNVVSTQQGLSDAESEVDKVMLVSGYYVLVPKCYQDHFDTKLVSAQMENGWLFDNNYDPTWSLEKRSQAFLPDVTYATMRVTVKPAKSSGGGEAKGGGSGSSSGNGGAKDERHAAGGKKAHPEGRGGQKNHSRAGEHG